MIGKIAGPAEIKPKPSARTPVASQYLLSRALIELSPGRTRRASPMNVSNAGITTFGSAAIVSPPANDTNAVKRDDAPSSPVQKTVEAAKEPGTGQFVDKKV
jgi:hypothetical protein